MQAPSTGSMRSFFWNFLTGCKKAMFLMMPIDIISMLIVDIARREAGREGWHEHFNPDKKRCLFGVCSTVWDDLEKTGVLSPKTRKQQTQADSLGSLRPSGAPVTLSLQAVKDDQFFSPCSQSRSQTAVPLRCPFVCCSNAAATTPRICSSSAFIMCHCDRCVFAFLCFWESIN